MAGFNRVIILGNMTRDPQLRYLPSNTPVCDFGLAVNRRYRDRDGNQKEEVCFVDVSAFGRQAETINQYMSKGRPILVEGRLRFDSWTGQDGQKRSKLSVTVENFQFVGGRGEGGGASHDQGPPSGGGQGGPSGPPTDESPPMDDLPF
jgi:single-strand DNA-binding protein